MSDSSSPVRTWSVVDPSSSSPAQNASAPISPISSPAKESPSPEKPTINYTAFPSFETYRKVLDTSTLASLRAIIATSAEDEKIKVHDHVVKYLDQQASYYERVEVSQSLINLIVMDTLNKVERLKEKWRAIHEVDPRSTLDSRGRVEKIPGTAPHGR